MTKWLHFRFRVIAHASKENGECCRTFVYCIQ